MSTATSPCTGWAMGHSMSLGSSQHLGPVSSPDDGTWSESSMKIPEPPAGSGSRTGLRPQTGSQGCHPDSLVLAGLCLLCKGPGLGLGKGKNDADGLDLHGGPTRAPQPHYSPLSGPSSGSVFIIMLARDTLGCAGVSGEGRRSGQPRATRSCSNTLREPHRGQERGQGMAINNPPGPSSSTGSRGHTSCRSQAWICLPQHIRFAAVFIGCSWQDE